MDQIQSIQPLASFLPIPTTLPIYPMQRQSQQQQQGFLPVTPVFDDSDSFSSSIVNVTNNAFSGVFPVIVVTTSPYLATSSDTFIGVNNTGLVPFSVVLPANPVTGKFYFIKDVSGTAALHNITVTAVGHTIDGSASALINTNYGSITLVFNGVQWSIV